MLAGCLSRDAQIPFPIKHLAFVQNGGKPVEASLVGLYPLYHEVERDSERWYIGKRIELSPGGGFHVDQPRSDGGTYRYFRGLFIASIGYDLGFIGWMDARSPPVTGDWITSAVVQLAPGNQDEPIVKALINNKGHIELTGRSLELCGVARPEMIGTHVECLRADVDTPPSK